MKASRRDWLRLGATLLLYAMAFELVALLLNVTGDCAPGVERCGEGARQLSFVVLALGAAWLAYIVFRFVRKHRS